MLLKKLSNFLKPVEHQYLIDSINNLGDYCNELERRLAEVEKPKRNYLSDDYTLCERCNNIHHRDIECNNK